MSRWHRIADHNNAFSVDFCRNGNAEIRKSMKSGATDGYGRSPGMPEKGIIEPNVHLRHQSTRPLSTTIIIELDLALFRKADKPGIKWQELRIYQIWDHVTSV